MFDPEITEEFYDKALSIESAKPAHFCSMKITQDVRDYAAAQELSEEEALKKGLEQKVQEFKDKGSQIYS